MSKDKEALRSPGWTYSELPPYHIEATKSPGAEEAALVEALEIAVEMGGGPAIMYAGKALEAFRTL